MSSATVGDIRDSQVAIGNHIIQINARDGATVHVAPSRRRARPVPRPSPLRIRPRPIPMFLDRVGEAAAARTALGAGELVEVVGAAGIGKTALLRRLVHEPLVDALPDGILFLSVRGRPADDVLHVVYSHFYDVPGRYRPTDGELRHALAEKRALIVLDDIDLSRDDVATIVNALPACVLALAGEERRAWGESCAVQLNGLPAADALALFERELGRSLTATERPLAEAICVNLNGHPLRILQRAAHTREAGVALEAAEAPQDIQTDGEKRRLLLLLAVLGAPVRRLHLSALTGLPDVEQLLELLLRRRLVTAADDGYQLAAGTDVPATDAELEAVRRQTLEYFIAWAEARQDRPDEVAAESEVLLGLLCSAGAAAQPRLALRLGRVIEGALMLAGLWGAWRLAIEVCRVAARALTDQPAVEAWVLHQLGTLALVRGDLAPAATQLEQALRLREAAGDDTGAAASRHNLQLLRAAPPPAQGHEVARDWIRAHARSTLAGGMGTVLLGAWLVWTFAFDDPVASFDVVPSEIDFAEQEIGIAQLPRDVGIRNTSRFAVRLARAAIDGAPDFTITADGCVGQELAPGSSCTVTAAFNPSAAGLRTGRLRLADTRGVALPEIALAGYGVTPRAVVPPPAPPSASEVVRVSAQDVDFGTREIGSIRIGTGSLHNDGTTGVRLRQLRLTGDSDFRLLEDGCSGISLPSGGRCVVEVEFRPTAAGARSGSVLVTSTAGVELSRLRLRGNGRNADVATPSDAASGGVATPRPPRILHLTVDSTRLRSQRELQLCFGVVDTERAVIEPTLGDVAPLGQQCLPIPVRTARYTLHAIGAGSQRAMEEVSVEIAAPRIDGFTARRPEITAGGASELCYVVSNVFAAEITPAVGAIKPVPDACIAVRPTASTTYVLVVEGFDGSRRRDTAAVRVRAANPLAPPRILRFIARPSDIAAGDSAQLCYAMSDVTAAEITPDVGRVRPAPQACLTVRPSRSTTYVLTVQGAGGTAQRQAAIRVDVADTQPPPPTRLIAPGASVTDARTVDCTKPIIASWTAVTDGRDRVSYDVVVQRQSQRPLSRWSDALRRTTSGTRLDISSVVPSEGMFSYRWTVTTLDVAGNRSAPASWYYFRCYVIE